MEQTNKAIIVCNHADFKGECTHRLHLWGKDKLKVYPRIKFFKQFFGELSPRLVDFIELATYIYAADQMVVRCQGRVDPHGLLWRRDMNMIIAVQDYDFWSDPQVKSTLERLLRFISDERYNIQFSPMREAHPEQEYFNFSDNMGSTEPWEQVMLFSGGLDSLGGAVEELISEGKNTVLVRHKSARKHKKRYEFLEKELQKRSNNKGTFFTIDTGKDGKLSEEYTQRNRSFLYFALAGTIAHLLGLDNIRFYENGPVSINLPMNPQVIGGRATRTTHPKTLYYFQELMRLISGKPNFEISNPFINKTKSDVVKLLIDNQCGDLIAHSMSCAHSWQNTVEIPHCGVCSQCIDRRVAIIAADALKYEDEKDYVVDFFTEAVDNKKDIFELENKNLLTSFFLRGKQISDQKYTYDDFEMDYPMLNEAALYMKKEPHIAANDIFKLYRRFANDILKVESYACSPKYVLKLNDLNNPLSPDSLSGILLRGIREVTEQKKEIPEQLPDFLFRQEGEMWRLRYDGGNVNFLSHYEGCNHIFMLLKKPKRSLAIDEILPSNITAKTVVDDDELNTNFTDTENFEPSIDKETKEACYRKLQELKNQLEEVKTQNNNILENQLQEEIDNIEEYLLKNIKPGGKARNLNKAAKRKEDKIRRNINTVIKKIEIFDQELAKHLKDCITVGQSPIYSPDTRIKWNI